MRTMLTIRIPVGRGNAAIQENTLGQLIENFTKSYSPESTYFLAAGGERTAQFVFDMKDPSQIPQICEPFFMKLDAKIEIQPVMNIEDLMRGLGALKG